MKKLIALLFLCSSYCFAQTPQTVTGRRLSLVVDSTKGYKLIQVPGAPIGTLQLSKELMDNILKKHVQVPPARKRIGFQLVVDQDAFVSSFNEDRDYTMGLQLTLAGERKNYKFVRWLFSLKDDDLNTKNWTATFSFSGFTPYHLEYNYVDRSDRPYAALSSISSSGMYSFREEDLTTTIKRRQFFRSSSLFGFMGKGTSQKAKFIQTAIHSGQRALASDPNDARPNPLGWEYAIASTSNFAAVVNYSADYANEFQYTIFSGTKAFAPFKLMVKPGVGFAAGTLYNNLNAGVQAQLGFFSTSIFNGNNEGAIFDLIENPGWFELSLTGEFFGQAWAHNSTLNGILFNRSRDIYHMEYNQIEKFTNYYTYGMELSYKRKISLGYSKVVRSNVVKDLQREQVFGRFVLRIGI